MALRYVLDAQVLIAAFMQPTNRGARQLLRCGARGEFEPIISTGILDELRMTLEGHRLVARHRRTQQISGYVDTLDEVFTIAEQPATIAGLARDEGDDFVATVVYTEQADGLVTKNQADFAGFCAECGFDLITTGKLLTQLGH